MSVNWQDSNIIVKSIDQSLNSCESMVRSRVQSPGFVNFCTEQRSFGGKGGAIHPLRSFCPPPELGLNKELALSQQLHCQLKCCPLYIFENLDLPPWPLNLFAIRTSDCICIALISRGDDGKTILSFDRQIE